MCVCVCLHVCMYVDVCVCVYIYIYKYIDTTHTHTQTQIGRITVICGSETWAIYAGQISRIQDCMKYLGSISGCAKLDMKRNNHWKSQRYSSLSTESLKQHISRISRMGSNSFPKVALLFSRNWRNAWKDSRRNGLTTLEPGQTTQSKPRRRRRSIN